MLPKSGSLNFEQKKNSKITESKKIEDLKYTRIITKKKFDSVVLIQTTT